MKLHHSKETFQELIELAAKQYNLPSSAVRKDYVITLILSHLEGSPYLEQVVFKGGTSLSKCYSNSIQRFSEDIDLTFIPEEGMSNNQINKKLKSIEDTLIGSGKHEKIESERNNSNKSSYVWLIDEYKDIEKIKVEIGSSVRPHPYGKKELQSYIHDYLEFINESEVIVEFQLKKVKINVLNIERTFVDKLMSVKRHAICGTLNEKVRHIYDIVKLSEMKEIQYFLSDINNLKDIIQITKNTDSVYLEKRDIPKEYNPVGPYAFDKWKNTFSNDIKANYENLHNFLLYTDEKQDWAKVELVFTQIDQILKQINE
jgi:predicted nucleotidyltransferase component of viral defense system